LISDRTKLVAVVHCSNALGTINPIRLIADAAHKRGALILVDGAQSTPHMPVDVQALDCDFFAFSGHKMCGPTASGALYGKLPLLEAMPPFMGGGEMIREVLFDRATYNDLPYKFEAGTPNIAESIGLGEAIRFLQRIGLQRIRQHDLELTRYCLESLQKMPEANILGPLDPQVRGGLVGFTFGDVHPHDIAQVLDQEGVAIRAGHHCTMPLHRKLNITASARASFYLYNTREEVDTFIEALKKAKKVFGACPTGRALGY
jgi:cysteine desulfurase/selenocysteine lyase